jgi:hypothetical protein
MSEVLADGSSRPATGGETVSPKFTAPVKMA